MQGSSEANTRNNIVFILTDIVETNLMDLLHFMRKEGCVMKHEAKRDFNTAIAAIKRLKHHVDKCSAETQGDFGDESDMLNAVLLTIVDRVGDDDMLLLDIYNYLKAMPSKGILTMNVDDAFSHLQKDENQQV
jgi:hypothetical protein